jgi:hypothetical protein
MGDRVKNETAINVPDWLDHRIPEGELSVIILAEKLPKLFKMVRGLTAFCPKNKWFNKGQGNVLRFRHLPM